MKVKFDETKRSVVEGFGVEPEEFKKLIESLKFEGKLTNECVKMVLDEMLTDNVKMALIFELGANFGQIVTINKIKETSEMDVLKQLQPPQEIL